MSGGETRAAGWRRSFQQALSAHHALAVSHFQYALSKRSQQALSSRPLSAGGCSDSPDRTATAMCSGAAIATWPGEVIAVWPGEATAM